MRLALPLAWLAAVTVASPAWAGPEGRARPGRALSIVHDPAGPFPVVGPRYAPVTIEFFCDFGGERYSSRIYGQLMELAERHPRRLRIVFYIGTPLDTPDSVELNEAAYEAFAQDKFLAFADAAFAHRGRPSPRFLAAYADAAGLEAARLARALADDRHLPVIARGQALRARRGSTINSRRLVVNGELVAGTLTQINEYEEVYDQAYAEARAMLDAGVPREQLFERVQRRRQAEREQPPVQVGKVDDTRRGAPTLAAPVLLGRVLPSMGLPALGSTRAQVNVTLFCNLASQTCASQWHKVERLLEIYPDEVRVVYWPLFDDDAQPDARLAAEAALCAGEQDRFWAFVDDAHRRRGGLDADTMLGRARELGLDADAFAACVSERRHARRVVEAVLAGRVAGVEFTPSIAVSGRLYVGFRLDDDLRAVVEEALRPGLLERAEDLRLQILQRVAPPPTDPAGESPNDG